MLCDFVSMSYAVPVTDVQTMLFLISPSGTKGLAFIVDTASSTKALRVKLLYRRATAMYKLVESNGTGKKTVAEPQQLLTNALHDYQIAVKLEPTNPKVIQGMQQVVAMFRLLPGKQIPVAGTETEHCDV